MKIPLQMMMNWKRNVTKAIAVRAVMAIMFLLGNSDRLALIILVFTGFHVSDLFGGSHSPHAYIRVGFSTTGGAVMTAKKLLEYV